MLRDMFYFLVSFLCDEYVCPSRQNKCDCNERKSRRKPPRLRGSIRRDATLSCYSGDVDVCVAFFYSGDRSFGFKSKMPFALGLADLTGEHRSDAGNS